MFRKLKPLPVMRLHIKDVIVFGECNAECLPVTHEKFCTHANPLVYRMSFARCTSATKFSVRLAKCCKRTTIQTLVAKLTRAKKVSTPNRTCMPCPISSRYVCTCPTYDNACVCEHQKSSASICKRIYQTCCHTYRTKRVVDRHVNLLLIDKSLCGV